jgi:hypothetical protein
MARILSELITYLLYKTPGWEQTLSPFLPFGLALVRRAFWRVKNPSSGPMLQKLSGFTLIGVFNFLGKSSRRSVRPYAAAGENTD